jgi:hypothetical protein
MPGQSATFCYHSLIAAVVNRAIDDLKGIGPKCRRPDTDQAMAFILSEVCEAYCLELGIDCEAVREKAAALYRKIIAKEEKPQKARYANSPARLPGSRAFPVSKGVILPGQVSTNQ